MANSWEHLEYLSSELLALVGAPNKLYLGRGLAAD